VKWVFRGAACAWALGLALGAGPALADDPAAPEPQLAPGQLSVDEVWELYTGNSELIFSANRQKTRWKAYYRPDGRMSGVEGGETQTGIWFVDPLGRHCFRWDGTTKTRCHVILKQGEGYVRVKDADKRYASEVHEGNPFNL
jgi:hypothetical protein